VFVNADFQQNLAHEFTSLRSVYQQLKAEPTIPDNSFENICYYGDQTWGPNF